MKTQAAIEKPKESGSDRDAFDEPKCFDILLNYNCSAKCLFCSQDFDWRKVPNDLPFRKAAETLYSAHKDGYRRLGFTGGEPTLRRDLPQLIALARRVGYTYIRIQTNGIRIADFDYCKSLADAGLTFVKFSIHGHDAETHDKLVAVPGAFDKCLKAIENLKKLNVGIGINIVLNEWNYRKLPEFYDLFLMKLRLSNFVIIAPLYEGNMTLNVPKMGARVTDMAPYIKKAYEMFTKINFPKPPLLLHFTPCILPGYEQQMLGWSAFNTMVVSPKGERRDLDMTATDHTVKTDECKKCVYNDRCIGFDASYARYFGTEEIKALRAIPERYDAVRAYPHGAAGKELLHARGARSRNGTGAGAPARTVLTDNEQCVVEVLKIKTPLSTQEFLKLAAGLPICKDCKDENAVVTAMETLVKLGHVERKFAKGKYLWSLKQGFRDEYHA